MKDDQINAAGFKNIKIQTLKEFFPYYHYCVWSRLTRLWNADRLTKNETIAWKRWCSKIEKAIESDTKVPNIPRSLENR